MTRVVRRYCVRVLRGRLLLPFVVAAVIVASAADARPQRPHGPLTEVIVELASPPLAAANPGRATYGPVRKLGLATAASRSYLARLDREQDALARRIESSIPSATVRWRYSIVANGLAVALPPAALPRLRQVAGIAHVTPPVAYRLALDRSPTQIGAPALWGPVLDTAGQGTKIGILDEGIDQTHPFFDPRAYAMPAGYPKGDTAFTSAKVIVARAFPPAGSTYANASKPFDPAESSHGLHVAGIAAGNAGTRAAGGVTVSGVAPKAYLGNYKIYTQPTDAGVGLDGNAPEIVAGIEAAVADGMDVINLSIGEPSVPLTRDPVARALGAAADAGVVPVVAAGNEFEDLGAGSVTSPGDAPKAITVAAVTTTKSGAANVIAGFSSAGPTPLSLLLKPDVAAPGVQILSAAPGAGWATLNGTSMASPHVAGSAALLRQRHPGWTVAQIKSALSQSGNAALVAAGGAEAGPTREGGGVVDLVRADKPLLFADPTNLSFGYLRAGATAARAISLTDAGGGAGDWVVSIQASASTAGVGFSAPATIIVPGVVELSAAAISASPEGEASGFVVLTRGADRRRIPFWVRVTAPKLASARHGTLRKPGNYRSTTRGGASLVTSYRYPERGGELPGPERVFRVTLGRKAVANFGVVVTSLARGVKVEPRIVVAGDENRLLGPVALPVNQNPYLRGFGEPVLAAGAILPATGSYDIVFDSLSAATAGAFGFRLWIDDRTAPSVRAAPRSVPRGKALLVRASDGGSGIDATSLYVTVDGKEQTATFRDGVIRVPTTALRRGAHTLRIQVSDYQETRNTENVARILGNTRVVTTRFSVR